MNAAISQTRDAGSPLPLWARAAFLLLPLSAFVVIAMLLRNFSLPLSGALPWVPSLDIALAWRIDGLSALMLLMITGVGSAVFVYAGGYLAGHPGQRRLYVLLSCFLIAMIGCVIADDVFVLFLFWEATSVLSFLLVGFDHHREQSRKSAQQALLITGSGGLALLAGFILLAQALGTTSISAMMSALPQAHDGVVNTALCLLVVGAFAKSAQFPLHFWLPNAMAAPTPVSAYLHSATMVKLGVYLLARFDAGVDDRLFWQILLQGAGSLTAAWGMVLALRERDLKRILAWSTVATLGTLITLVGMSGEDAAIAIGALLLAHSLYKASLFFVAGNVDHGTGTRVIDHLGNLRFAMPWTATAAALAGLSMAGIPMSFGYVAKDLIGSAKAAEGVLTLVPLANMVFSAIAMAVAGIAAIRIFWRHAAPQETPEAHEGGMALILPPLVLASIGIVLGLMPVLTQPLIEEVGMAITPGHDPISAIFPVISAVEWLAFAVAFALGLGVFLFWDAFHRMVDAALAPIETFSSAAFYQRMLKWIPRLAAATTRKLQHGRSPAYMALAVAASALAILVPLIIAMPTLHWPAWSAPSAGVTGGSLLVVAGALIAVYVRQRLVMMLGAGLVGYGSAVIFLFTGAPDVAFTQVVVETVFVIIIAAALLTLKERGLTISVAEPQWRPIALSISLIFASAFVALLLAALALPFDDSLSRWFGEQSLPAAHGRNVVNVILVDFRALDTLGEVSVVMLSLLAATPILRAVLRARDNKQELWNKRPVILQTVAGPLYWLMLAASLVVLLRGHNEPGGGFIGGLLAVTASVLWAVAHGSEASTRRLPLRSPVRLAALGVLTAALSGIPAWFGGNDFLTHLWFDLPLGFTTLPLSTVLLFDLGVYLCVWGALAGYAIALLQEETT